MTYERVDAVKQFSSVVPALVAGIHAFLAFQQERR
jgi:hypothetical protein